MKELSIGEIGEIDGVKVRCVKMKEREDCGNCFFLEKPLEYCATLKCTPTLRIDSNWVYFVKVSE